MAGSSNELTRFRSRFWQQTVFHLVIAGCGTFVAATALAMVCYAGGSYANKAAPGYTFFGNFFSDLGRTVSVGGHPNRLASLLFTLGLGTGGVSLMAFFVAFRQFFQRQLWLGCLGSSAGILAGGGFIGVAFTPADIAGEAHGQFTVWAFRCFLLAAVLFTVAIYYNRAFPRAWGLVFLAFAALLDGYLLLLTKGPPLTSLYGVTVQVVGQKVIAYASVLSVTLLSWASLKLNSQAGNPTEDQSPALILS